MKPAIVERSEAEDFTDRAEITSLTSSFSGTNLERAGDYNQRTVLQLIRLRGETTRVELARQTGLTSPTIANITNRLVDLDLVRHSGRKRGARGQPALMLEINRDGALAIGLNIDRDHLTLVAVDLAGEVRGRLGIEISFPTPQDVQDFVRDGVPQLIAEAGLNEDKVLGLGIAIPDDLGTIDLPNRPEQFGVWNGLDLDALLAEVVSWPILRDNDAASAARGETQHVKALEYPTFFYLLISAGLGGGTVIDRTYHRGATSRSGEIGLMPDATADPAGAIIQDTVSLSSLRQRLQEAGCEIAAVEDLATAQADREPIIEQWLDDAARSLTSPLVALSFLLNLDAIVIGGRLPLRLIERLSIRLKDALSHYDLPYLPHIVDAAMAVDAPAIGAAMLPFIDQLLPSESTLIQVGRN